MKMPTFREAVARALRDELAADPTVLHFGEDIAAAGGVFQVTRGLAEEFGSDRVFDTPISELALASAAFGSAVSGYRPVIEVMFGDFATLVTDSLINQAAKYEYWSGGRHTVPITVRTTTGAGMRFGAIHSQNPAFMFMPVPGMTVVAPSCAEDAYALLRAAIRHDGPVIFLEHKGLYQKRAKVALEEHHAELGSARVVLSGDDVTIVSVMRGVHDAVAAAGQLAEDGVRAEVIDLRSLRPMDVPTVLESVGRTGSLLVVDESPSFGGWGAELVAQVAEHASGVTVRRIGAAEHPLPFSPVLEDAALPSVAEVVEAARSMTRAMEAVQ
jgi:pyruvate/2-oxoglutarate/acetoin dehydrogenase E1 component